MEGDGEILIAARPDWFPLSLVTFLGDGGFTWTRKPPSDIGIRIGELPDTAARLPLSDEPEGWRNRARAKFRCSITKFPPFPASSLALPVLRFPAAADVSAVSSIFSFWRIACRYRKSDRMAGGSARGPPPHHHHHHHNPEMGGF